jgi:hypothetical protein
MRANSDRQYLLRVCSTVENLLERFRYELMADKDAYTDYSADMAIAECIALAESLRRGDRALASTMVRSLEESLDCFNLPGDRDLDTARSGLKRLRHGITHWDDGPTVEKSPVATKPATGSRRTRCATSLAVRLLPPAHRARYRQEFAAELAELPRCDQAPYAFRLACRAWSLRCSLTGQLGVRATKVVVVVAASTAEGAVLLAGLDWPAAVLGSTLVIALMWTVNSRDRTRHLASLIRAARKR